MFFASPTQHGSSIVMPATSQPSQDAMIDPENRHELDEDIAVAMGVFVPWAVSIVLHTALVVIAIAIVWITLPQIEAEEQIVPSAVFNQRANPALNWKATRTPTESRTRQRSVSKEVKVTRDITSKVKADTALIGVHAGAESKADPFAIGVGMVGVYGRGDFIGSPIGNAKHIAYVVDASGSLLDTLPFVMLELRSSISKLVDAQTFTVIFYTGDKPLIAGGAQGMLPATSENKARVLKWLEQGHVVPQGQASPIDAVKRALSFKPDLIFLLSDNITGSGRYELAQSQLLAEVTKANVGKTKINTIQFLYRDPLADVDGMRPTLEMISLKTNGLFKFISGRELGIGQ